MSWASLTNNSKEVPVNIVFEALHSPTDYQYKPNIAHFAEQQLLIDKPRLQRLGTKLQEIKLQVRFHASIKPFGQVRADLQNAAVNGSVLQWVFGTGEVLGDFVIVGLDEKPRKTFADGLPMALDVDIELKEYAGPGIAEQTGIDSRKAAFANKAKGGGFLGSTTFINIPTTPIQEVSKNVQEIKKSTKKISALTEKLKKAQMSVQQFKNKVIPILGKIQTAKNAAESAIAIAKNLRNVNSLSAALSNVGVMAGSMDTALGSSFPSVTAIGGMASDLSAVTGSMDNASQPMQSVSSWWHI